MLIMHAQHTPSHEALRCAHGMCLPSGVVVQSIMALAGDERARTGPKCVCPSQLVCSCMCRTAASLAQARTLGGSGSTPPAALPLGPSDSRAACLRPQLLHQNVRS